MTSSAEETRSLASSLGEVLEDGDVVCLIGGLGAGKTQFGQGVGRGLGISCAIPSPTFNLVFEYPHGRVPLYHFDVYRLDDPSQLEDIDFFALVDADTPGAALVEWANRFEEEMPAERLEVTLSAGQATADPACCLRRIEAVAYGTRAEALLGAWEERASRKHGVPSAEAERG